jgi:ribonuclease E
LRDIGGLIVIDFIDMESTANQRAVEDMLRDAVKMDRARIQLGRLSRFGLLELSRQRLRPALSETTHIHCPRCSGMGTIRSVESMSLALLRLIGEEARKERTGRVIAQVPVDVATYLMNEKREWLHEIESRDRVSLVIVPNPHLQTPAYSLRRVRDDEKELPENTAASYEIPEQPTLDDSNIGNRDKKPQTEAPLVPSIVPVEATPLPPPPPPPSLAPAAAPVPMAAAAVPQVGVFVRLWRFFFGVPAAPAVGEASATAVPAPRERPAHRDARSDRFRERDRTRGRDRERDREPRREPVREGAREPRRDGRPRGDNRDHRDNGRGEQRGDARRADGPRTDGPRTDGPRTDGPRTDAPRTDAPRADGPRADGPRNEASRGDGRVERADGPARSEGRNGAEPRPGESGERTGGERGGRGRRRRGRGRRDGGENTGNGQLTNPEANGRGPGPDSPAPRIDGPRAEGGSYQPPTPEFSRPEVSSAGFSPAPTSPPPSSPPPPPAAPATTASAASEPPRPASQEKYVVWSGSGDPPRSGPDDR